MSAELDWADEIARNMHGYHEEADEHRIAAALRKADEAGYARGQEDQVKELERVADLPFEELAPLLPTLVEKMIASRNKARAQGMREAAKIVEDADYLEFEDGEVEPAIRAAADRIEKGEA